MMNPPEALNGLEYSLGPDHPDWLPEAMVHVTPEAAATWLSLFNTANRAMRRAYAMQLAKAMAQNKFAQTGGAILFDINGVLIDGQHRLQAIIESGKTLVIKVIWGLQPDVRSKIDIGQKRSPMDILSLAGYRTVGVLAGVCRIVLAREDEVESHMYAAGRGLGGGGKYSGEDMLALLSEQPKWDQAVEKWIKMAKNQRFVTEAVFIYCMAVLEEIDGLKAHEFGYSLSEGSTGEVGDARGALLKTLDSIRVERGGARIEGSVKGQHGKSGGVGIGEALFIIFSAWNDWIDGEKRWNIYQTKPRLVKGERSKRPIPTPHGPAVQVLTTTTAPVEAQAA